MSDTTDKAPKPSLTDSLLKVGRLLQRYVVVWFVLLLAGVYGFVLFRIQVAQTAQPSQASIDNQLQTVAAPHVDKKVVEQIQSLQDHSVNVNALFDQARNNPFQE